MKFLPILFIMLWTLPALAQENIAQHLQNISVTVKSKYSSGSGVIITRNIQLSNKDETKETINFVLTAGHVISSLRSVRNIIEDGKEKKIIEFGDAILVKQLIENGRKVGKLEMSCQVLKYSDATNGEDLALLMIRKRNFVNASTNFYIGKSLIPIGTQLLHVGSMFGEPGANSMTNGIMSQVGRVLDLGSSGGIVFDQTSVTAFGGSSGGGVFLADGENQGQYIGCLVRGAGEGFNFIVPIRRLSTWAKANNILWILDANVKAPYLKEILKMPLEDTNSESYNKKHSDSVENMFPFLLVTNKTIDY